MQTYSFQKKTNVKQKNIVDVIKNVDDYSSFLPGIKSSYTYDHKDNAFTGVLTVVHLGLQDTYESRVIVKEEDSTSTIKALALDGPFETMLTEWIVKKVNTTTSIIKLTVKIKWQNVIYQALFSKSMEDISKTMMDAFARRAMKIDNDS